MSSQSSVNERVVNWEGTLSSQSSELGGDSEVSSQSSVNERVVNWEGTLRCPVSPV